MTPKGYTYSKKNTYRPYVVQISINSKLVYLGSFATEEEAREAYTKERAANPVSLKNGGRKPGFRHPTKPCDVCKEHYAVPNLARHRVGCERKAKAAYAKKKRMLKR